MLGFPINPTHQIPYNSVGPRPIGPNPKPDTCGFICGLIFVIGSFGLSLYTVFGYESKISV
jgi:hypothetical protein